LPGGPTLDIVKSGGGGGGTPPNELLITDGNNSKQITPAYAMHCNLLCPKLPNVLYHKFGINMILSKFLDCKVIKFAIICFRFEITFF
jgi:hypothetical protein